MKARVSLAGTGQNRTIMIQVTEGGKVLRTYRTRHAINNGMGADEIRRTIINAKFDAEFSCLPEHRKAINAIPPTTEATRIQRTFTEAAAKPAAERPAARAPAKPAAKPARKPATKAPARPPRAARTARDARRAPAPKPKPPIPEPQAKARAPEPPEIDAGWIRARLEESAKGDLPARRSASAVHSSRLFVAGFLAKNPQAGVPRTIGQKQAAAAIFGALYSASPQFRLLLTSLAAQQYADTGTASQGFTRLQGFLSSGKDLMRDGAPDDFRSAELYIRHFLFRFAPRNQRYREELNQLPGAKAVLERGEPAALRGPMDADTLTTAILYLRRWTLEHRGRPQEEISLWKAPEVMAPQAARKAIPRSVFADARAPRVAAIGDSITEGYAGELQRILGNRLSGAEVSPYGRKGEDITQIAARFRNDVLGKPHDTIIIQLGMARMSRIPLVETQKAVMGMVSAARESGMKVIVLGITPWAGGADAGAQNRTFILNDWMKNTITRRYPGTVFVDTSQLGEPVRPGGRILRLKKEYDSGDGMTPNQTGRELIAKLIAQTAFNIAPGKEDARRDSERFASQHWRDLDRRIFAAVRSGRPAELLAVAENRPSGFQSLESALASVERKDIERANDQVFNDLLKKDSGFLTFCRTGRDRARTASIAREGVRMSERTRADERRFIAMTIKSYINHRANQPDDIGKRLGGDLRVLLKDTLKLGERLNDRSPSEDIATLAAISVYMWRMANPTAGIGAWSGARMVPRRTAPPARQIPEEKPREEGGRRRVINF